MRPGAEAGVADTIGSILMVAITVVVATALGLLLLSFEGPVETPMATLATSLHPGLGGWGTGDESVRVSHLGGEAVAQSGTRIVIQVNGGTPVVLENTGLGFAGSELKIGQAWSHTLTLAATDSVQVAVVATGEANTLLVGGTLRPGSAAAGTTTAPPLPTVRTDVASHTVRYGTVTGFTAMQDDGDGGASATLAEAATAQQRRSPASATAVGAAANPANVLGSNEARATLDNPGEGVDATGFGNPAGATAVTKVVIGFEGQASNPSGTAPTVALSYKVGTATGATSRTLSVTGTSDADFTSDVTADRDWTLADITNLHVVVTASALTNRNVLLDHLYADVTYTGLGGATFTLRVELAWASVPTGSSHRIEMLYSLAAATGDTFQAQVWTGSAWRTCPGGLSSSSPTVYSCDLVLPAEHNGGAPRMRIVDANPAGATAASLLIGHAQVVSS